MAERESPRADDSEELSEELERLLLELAHRAIETRLRGDASAAVHAADFPPPLRPLRATFVTLRKAGELRGCIGSLESRSPLVESVWDNARRAAFRDPRFEPLRDEELDSIDIHISILSPLERVAVRSEEELLSQLRPDIDGLVLEDPPYRATFLPAVWESLPEPGQFVRELKRKAGLSADHWSSSLEVWRYSAHSIPR